MRRGGRATKANTRIKAEFRIMAQREEGAGDEGGWRNVMIRHNLLREGDKVKKEKK